MSVRTGDRGEGKLEVLNRARELKNYTLGLVRNEKVFPKSTRWLYASPIAQETRAICISIKYANSIYIDEKTLPEEISERRLHQVRANAHIEALLDLIDDAYLAGYISGERAEYWTGLTLKTLSLLKSWMKSDKQKINKVSGQ